jgi:hypothetical protein
VVHQVLADRRASGRSDRWRGRVARVSGAARAGIAGGPPR